MDAQESQVENKDDKDVKDRNENMAIFTEKLKAELHQRTEQLLGKFSAADIELDQALELAVLLEGSNPCTELSAQFAAVPLTAICVCELMLQSSAAFLCLVVSET